MILGKILVTGSNGFLGSHLIGYLQYHKKQVIGLSQNSQKKDGIHQIKNDVRTISRIPKDISCIVHLAALTDINHCERYPKACFDTNVGGTQNMLELGRKHDSKFIFASTSHVYGIPKKLPVSETAELHPLSVYAASKACAEMLCEGYSKSYGLDIMVVRAFSIYGPASPSHLVTSKIIEQILYENKITIGNLSPKRDFLYVSDLISAYSLLIKRNLTGFSIFNVGFGKSISILELCQKLIKISGKKISVNSDKNLQRKSEIENIVCDISKIKKLGWKPKILLEEGLSNTFHWFANSKL
jgi:nucleoside-diphosphate-sugar epimerase